MSSNFQDWNPVVLKKSNPISKPSPTFAKIVNPDDEPKKMEFFEKSFCIKITQLRNEKKWTRADLALKLKMKENDLADIENINKKVKYNGEFVNKCKRLFGNFDY